MQTPMKTLRKHSCKRALEVGSCGDSGGDSGGNSGNGGNGGNGGVVVYVVCPCGR
jgi:hypothetical protein